MGGNNKVAMPQLKSCFEQAGFGNVSTYINSGNVLFDSDEANVARLINRCEQAIEHEFGFSVVCMVLSAVDYADALENAPAWWDENKSDKNNAIFVIPPATPADIDTAIGGSKPEYEKIAVHGQVIFWTAPLKSFSRTRYSKIVGTKWYGSITIRNANTAKKLLELAKEL